jgi:hypothetical protein
LLAHLTLELDDALFAGVGDDQIIDVDADDQPLASFAARVHTMFGTASLETK